MFCNKCGKKNTDDSLFCYNCESKLNNMRESIKENSREGIKDHGSYLKTGEYIEEVDIREAATRAEASSSSYTDAISDAEIIGDTETSNDKSSVDIDSISGNDFNSDNKSIPCDNSTSCNNSKSSNKKLKSALILLIALSLIGLSLYLFCSKSIIENDRTYNNFVYLKDNEILFRNLKEDTSISVSKELFKTFESQNRYFFSSLLNPIIKINNNVNKTFYMSNIEFDSSDFSFEADLYYIDNNYKKLNSKKGLNIGNIIATNLSSYKLEISSDGKLIGYYKKTGSIGQNSNGDTLYINNLEHEEKISDDVTEMTFSQDSKSILYSVKKDDSITYYIKELSQNGKEELIDSDVKKILFKTPNFEKIYYTKYEDRENDIVSIYVKEKGKGKEKLASNVSEVHGINEKGNIIYGKSKDSSMGFNDLFDDDLYAYDFFMKYPVVSDFIYYYGYNRVYDTKAYNAAVAEYEQKLLRDSIREEFQSKTFIDNLQDLYIYDDDIGEQKIGTNVSNVIGVSKDVSTVVYAKLKKNYIKKVKMSELSNYQPSDAYYEMISLYCEKNPVEIEIYLSNKEEEKKILTFDDINPEEIFFTDYIEYESDSKTNFRYLKTDFINIYYLDEYNSDEHGRNLVSCSIENLDERTIIDKGVIGYTLYDNSTILYRKYNDPNVFYCNDIYLKSGDKNEKIANSIDTESGYFFDENTNTFVAVENFDRKTFKGTLVVVKDYEKTIIANDVYGFFYNDPTCVLYLKEYDTKKDEGELWFYSGENRNIRIDYDVKGVLWKSNDVKNILRNSFIR